MSTFEVNEVWIPAMGARGMDDIAFQVSLEQIRADLGPGSVVKGTHSRVLVTVKIDARSEEKAKALGNAKIAGVMRDRPFIIDGSTPRFAIKLN